MKYKIAIGLVCVLAVFTMAAFHYFKYFDGKLHVVFCDVGQGDAIYIRTPKGDDILIDGGPDKSVLKCLDENRPFWDRTLELVFATHPDADHITGFVDIVQNYKIKSYNTSILEKETGVFEELSHLLEERKIPVRQLVAGDRFTTPDGILIMTLWPQSEYVEAALSDDTNAYSLVQKLTYGETTILLTGDVTFDTLNQLMEDIGSIDIFKVPHHGSYTGINEDTFLYTKPSIVIISNGKNNRYGHPHASVINELKENGIKYIRTDQEGSIRFASDGKRLRQIN